MHHLNHLMRSTAPSLPTQWVFRVLLAVLVPCACAQAQSQDVDYSGMALRWARTAAAASVAEQDVPLRLEVSAGALDSRLKLAPCANVETYLPYGSHLWGHSHVGLRCVDGSTRWNVTIPVTVKAFGAAWVVRGQVLSGSPLRQGDVIKAEVDWAEDSSPVLVEPASWLGQSAARVLNTGQALRQGMVRPMQVFQAGTQVRVVAQGQGFQISSDGQALTAGVIGEIARVRLDSGRITSGTVMDAHTVVISL